MSNEGGVDYRKAQAVTPKDLEKFHVDAQRTDAIPQLLSPLQRKDVELKTAEATIIKLDKVSIRLRDGYLRDCNESWRNPLRKFAKNCEIGILFRAFELGEGQDFNFKPGAERDARLVYFSHDVQPGQFFNLHNMPVYGPIAYQGRPLGIDVFIIEIDAEHQQAFALLKALGSAGAKAFAPASPVLSVLDSLGASLLSSGTDDIEFRYSFVLDPGGGYKGTLYATAEAGDYVLIRTEDRSQQIEWNNLFLDHNTGRVWVNRGNRMELFRDQTYLTVQVLRNAGSENVSLAQNTYGEFRDALERDSTDKATKLEEGLMKSLGELAEKRVQIRAFNAAQKKFEQMQGACGGSDEAAWKREAFDLLEQVKESVTILAKCESEKPKPCRSDLSGEQVDYLLRRMRERPDVKDEVDLKKFTREGFPALQFDDFARMMCPPSKKKGDETQAAAG